VPVAPKRTVFGSTTVVASKPLTLKIPTLILLVLFGLVVGGLTARSNVYGNQSLSLEINSTEIALSHPRKPQLIGHWTYVRVTCINGFGCQDSEGNVLSPAFRHPRKHRVRCPSSKPMFFEIETKEFQSEPVLRN
jgi:hypothetical protein